MISVIIFFNIIFDKIIFELVVEVDMELCKVVVMSLFMIVKELESRFF